MMKFRDLSIGEFFIFASERDGVNGLRWSGAYGPWVKDSARSYHRANDDSALGKRGAVKIGSINANVYLVDGDTLKKNPRSRRVRKSAGPQFYANGKPVVNPGCRWFALCRNAAVKLRDAGPLGAVPICQRCDDKVSRIDSDGAPKKNPRRRGWRSSEGLRVKLRAKRRRSLSGIEEPVYRAVMRKDGELYEMIESTDKRKVRRFIGRGLKKNPRRRASISIRRGHIRQQGIAPSPVLLGVPDVPRNRAKRSRARFVDVRKIKRKARRAGFRVNPTARRAVFIVSSRAVGNYSPYEARGMWIQNAAFYGKASALEYARALARKYPRSQIKVEKK